MNVTIVQTGTANLASVITGFERLGADVDVTRDADRVRNAQRVVLPGVGTFAAGRAALDEAQAFLAMRERVAAGRPTLGICLGWQLFSAASEESPGAEGLAVIPRTIERFAPGARCPQMGWNRVATNGSLVEDGWAYFANSYALKDVPEDWATAWAEHGGERFAAAAQKDGVLGCQFHPELSGDWGIALLGRWLEDVSC